MLLEDNPSEMTLDGTNTWVLRAPREARPSSSTRAPRPTHLGLVAAHGPVSTILLTHGHPDHAEGARRFAELVDAPVCARPYALGSRAVLGTAT